MILNKEEIKLYAGTTSLVQLGGKTVDGFVKATLHTESGAVLQGTWAAAALIEWTVGLLNEQGELQEAKTFGVREKDFFEATQYFEKLIEENSQSEQGDNAPPSMGKFIFYKQDKKTAATINSQVKINGMDTIYIDYADAIKAFTPPQTKPFGRLDLSENNNPKYAAIKGRFALKYNSESTKALADGQGINEGDCAVYDMTPYSVSDDPSEDATPQEVNEKSLSPDEIEGEELKPRKKEKKQAGEKSDAKKEGEKEKEDRSKESEQEKGEKSEEQENEGAQNDQDGEQDSEREDMQGAKNKQQGKHTTPAPAKKDEQGEENTYHRKEPAPQHIKKSDADDKKQDKITPADLIEALKTFLQSDDLKADYRKQRSLILTLDSYSQGELQDDIYTQLGLPSKMTKKDFLNLVTTKTAKLFS